MRTSALLEPTRPQSMGRNGIVFEGEMNFLGILLHQAALYSKAKIDALAAKKENDQLDGRR